MVKQLFGQYPGILFQEAFYQLFYLEKFQEEPVVSIQRMNDPEVCLRDQLRQRLLLDDGKENVRFDADDQGFRPDPLQRGRKAAPCPAYVMGIHAKAQRIVAEGGEAAGQLFTLVALIGGGS